MFKIKDHKVVFFYDKPLVIISLDDLAKPCISLLVDDQDDWLVCQVSAEDFNDFCAEGKDLLSVMKNPQTTFGLFKDPWISEDEEYDVKPILPEDVKSEWFPGPGFKLKIKDAK